MCSLERKNGRCRNWMTVLTVALGAVVVGLFSGENASAIGNQGNCRTSHAGYWAPICKYEAACTDQWSTISYSAYGRPYNVYRYFNGTYSYRGQFNDNQWHTFSIPAGSSQTVAIYRFDPGPNPADFGGWSWACV